MDENRVARQRPLSCRMCSLRSDAGARLVIAKDRSGAIRMLDAGFFTLSEGRSKTTSLRRVNVCKCRMLLTRLCESGREMVLCDVFCSV